MVMLPPCSTTPSPHGTEFGASVGAGGAAVRVRCASKRLKAQQDPAERDASSNPNLARDQLANERTLLAWVRTSIAIMALGFVVARFGLLVRELGQRGSAASSTGISTVFGIGLVLCGGALIVLATLRYARTGRALERNVYRWSPASVYVLAAVVVIVAVLLGIYLLATA